MSAKVMVNDVVGRHTDDKRKVTTLQRVLWLDRDHDAVVLFTLDGAPKKPTCGSYRALIHDLESGAAFRAEFRLPTIMLRDENEIPANYRKTRDKNWQLMKPLLAIANEPEIYHRGTRGPLVERHAKLNRKTRKAILRFLYRFWKYGKIANAFLPVWEHSGSPGKTRAPKNAKRGRPRKCVVTGHDPTSTGVNVTAESEELLLLGYDLFYKNDNRHAVKGAYDLTLNRFFAAGYEERNGVLVPIPRPAHEVPTIGQFKYVVKRERDATDVARARMGEIEWNLKSRALLGTARDYMYGPGERFEIDSTIADVYLVSRYNRDWIIGRPVIYVVIDVYSRLIVGLYIGLIGPSWEGTCLALMNAFSNKVDYCQRFGITLTHDMWPAQHLPQKLLADRADLIGPISDGLQKGLGIETEIAAAFRGDWKGPVERRFRIINEGTVEWVAGAVRARRRKCGERDYRLDATLNIGEFTRVVINCVREHNLFTPRADLLTKEMIQDNLRPYSVDMWKWGMENLTGGLKRRNLDEVRAHLLPSKPATVTARGIECNSMLYTSDYAQKENWFARARSGSWRINVKVDRNSTDEIYFMPEGASSFVTCRLIDSNDRFANLTVEEVIDCLEYQKLLDEDRMTDERREIAAIDADTESVIESATAAKKRSKAATPDRARIAQIKQNRKSERDIERILNAKASKTYTGGNIIPLSDRKTQGTSSQKSEKDEALLRLIKQERDSRWKNS